MGRHSTAHEFNDAPTNDSQNPANKRYIIQQDTEPNTMQKRIFHAVGLAIDRHQAIKINPTNKSRT